MLCIVLMITSDCYVAEMQLWERKLDSQALMEWNEDAPVLLVSILPFDLHVHLSLPYAEMGAEAGLKRRSWLGTTTRSHLYSFCGCSCGSESWTQRTFMDTRTPLFFEQVCWSLLVTRA